jgi:hypothetical protein
MSRNVRIKIGSGFGGNHEDLLISKTRNGFIFLNQIFFIWMKKTMVIKVKIILILENLKISSWFNSKGKSTGLNFFSI